MLFIITQLKETSKMKSTKTEYKNVYLTTGHMEGRGLPSVYGYRIMKDGEKIHSQNRFFKTARECALALDKKLIEKGYEPINILKKA
jgi:hypothetical protein